MFICILVQPAKLNMDPSTIYPVMGVPLGMHNSMHIDLSVANVALSKEVFEAGSTFQEFLMEELEKSNKTFALGGYLENRIIYSRSNVFASGESTFRNIHLGVDIWTDAGSPVYCPVGGRVHSFNDNTGFGNYGPTLILEHQLRGGIIYSLYGQLSHKDLHGWQKGMPIEKGVIIGHLGSWEENGCWPPHLHFQLIKNIGAYDGDFPGVCEESQLASFREICPDPNTWIQSPLLA